MGKRPLIIFAIFLIINAMPLLSFAALVPQCVDGSGQPAPCSFKDLVPLFQNVMDFLLKDILVPLATIAIAFVGIQYLMALGNPGKLTKVHETGKDILWGIAIALAAYAIIETIFRVLTGGGVWSITG